MCTGWINVASMRVLKLLGACDPGAAKSLSLLACFGFAAVLLTSTLPLLLLPEELAKLTTNNINVQKYFSKIIFMLAIHCQLRILSIITGCL